MENYTENSLNQNRDPYCPRSSWSAKKAISNIWRKKICCISCKVILATFNISIQTRNKDNFRCYPMWLYGRFQVVGVFERPWNKAIIPAKKAQEKQPMQEG